MVRAERGAEFEIDVSADAECVRLRLRGSLNQESATLLEAALHSLLAEDGQRVVMDLGALRSLDLPGVRALITLNGGTAPIGDRLRIVGVTPTVHELLERTGVCRLFPVELARGPVSGLT